MLLLIFLALQLMTEFVEKERIPLDGVRPATILLGRDTRPSGESLLEAAKQVNSLFPINKYELCPNVLVIADITFSTICLCFTFG